MKETGDAEVQPRRALHHTLCFDLQRRCMNQTYAGEEPEDQAGGSRGISSVGIAQVFVLHGDKIVCRWKFVDIRIYISSAEKSAAPRPRRQMCPVSPHPAVRPSTLERRGGEGPGGVQASHRCCRSVVAAAHRGLAIPLGSVHLGTKPRELLVGGWGGCRRQRLTAAGAIAAVGCHASLGGEDCLGVVLVREINAQRAHRARGGGCRGEISRGRAGCGPTITHDSHGGLADVHGPVQRLECLGELPGLLVHCDAVRAAHRW
jgi:hypothetical protein